MEAKLYVILGSHACRTAMLMLEHKEIPYERVELPTGLHPFALRLRGVAGNPAPFRKLDDRPHRMIGMADRYGTVPTLLVDGRQVKTNREIARCLEELGPDPPLFPSEPELRHAVEEAERWGDEVFQMIARRLTLAAGLHGRDALFNRGDDGRLGPLLWRQQNVRLVGTRLIAVLFGAKRAEPEMLVTLPGHLDRIDRWVEAGVLSGEELNAADFMIAPSIALLCYVRNLQGELEGRPALGLVDRVLPDPAAPRAAALSA
jgi:glutathione S-transferase